MITVILLLAGLFLVAYATRNSSNSAGTKPTGLGMAILQSVLGTITQKLDNIRASKWKDKNVLARMPQGYTDANTAAQQAQRRKFAALTALGRQLKGLLIFGFNSFRGSMTWLNAFNKVNKSAVTDDGTNASITWASIKVALGSLLGVAGMDVTGAEDAATSVNVTWTANENGTTGFATDESLAMVVDNNGIVLGTRALSETRTDGTSTVQLSRALSVGEDIHIYLFFRNPNTAAVCDSAYVTKTVTA